MTPTWPLFNFLERQYDPMTSCENALYPGLSTETDGWSGRQT